MSDIQRYTRSSEGLSKCEDGLWVKHPGHLKAMAAKDDLIDGLSDGLNDKDIEIEAQAKEIEELKDFKRNAFELIRLSPIIRNSTKWKELTK